MKRPARRRLLIAWAAALYLLASFLGAYAVVGSFSRAGWFALATALYLGCVALLCGFLGFNELWRDE